jgi:hypothetical protein
MQFDPIPIIVAFGYLAFAVVWMNLFNKRLEPWMRARIGKMLGVKIVYGGGFRRTSWKAVGEAAPGTGCLITFWEIVVTFIIGGGMVFLGLLVTGLILFSIYE